MTEPANNKHAYEGTEYVHYLWHLDHAEVIDIDPEPSTGRFDPPETVTINTPIWSEQVSSVGGEIENLPEVTVALIDNGCSLTHPNLPADPALDLRLDADAAADTPQPPFGYCLRDPIDLATHPYGATYFEKKADASGRNTRQVPQGRTLGGVKEAEVAHFAGLSEALRGIGIDIDAGAPSDENGLEERLSLRNLVAELETSKGVRREIQSYDQDFARHGTLAAGVIGGRPTRLAKSGEAEADTIGYFGADPFCRIVPINTSFEPGLGSLIRALLYAVLQGVDVICMPRGVDEVERRRTSDGKPVDESRDPRASRLTSGDDPDRALFEWLLRKIGQRVPVVLASGNSGYAKPEYPAVLATPHSDLISVGAVNGRSALSSYSSGRADDEVDGATPPTLHAPSDDAEALREADLRWDPDGQRAEDHNLKLFKYPPDYKGPVETPFVGWAVLSTDIPGAYGAESGPFSSFERSPANPSVSSLYASFGGTSAACCLVAGIVALMQRQFRLKTKKGERLDGGTTKKLLTANAKSEDQGPGALMVVHAQDTLKAVTELAKEKPE